MTLVHFHLADAEGRGLDGSVSLVPTRRVTVADAIRLPVAQTVKLTAGEATAEVMPSTTQWAWRVSELVAGGIVRYVEVPDKESAEYSELADVDPKTLDKTTETVAAWETVTRTAQGVLDKIGSIDDKVQAAAASADAAKASETVASQESAKAAAAASKAQSSQAEAASSASLAHEAETTAQGLIGEAKTIAGQLTETAGQVKQDAATASQAAETATVKADAAATAQNRAETARQAAETAMKTAQAKADAAGVSADKVQASETAAAKSAESAGQSKSAASASENAAARSAAAASDSAAKAKSSETAASASAASAKTDAQAAGSPSTPEATGADSPWTSRPKSTCSWPSVPHGQAKPPSRPSSSKATGQPPDIFSQPQTKPPFKVAFLIKKGEELNILNKGKPKHKHMNPRRQWRKLLTALAVAISMAVAPAAMADMNGYDISNWQCGIDTATVPADFVIVGTTWGSGGVYGGCLSNGVNTDANRQLAGAINSGKETGVYHYARGGNPETEARFFVDNVRGYVHKSVLILDWEAQDNAAWGDKQWPRRWAREVKRLTGVNPIIYTMDSGYWQVAGMETELNCGIWIAQYATNMVTGYQTAPWNIGARGEVMRQYTSNGSLSGWSGRLDLNRFRGDRAAWRKYANPDDKGAADLPSVKPKPQPTTAPAVDLNALATRTIRGDFGNDPARRQALGGNYAAVMQIVNSRLGGGSGGTAATGSRSVVVRSGDTMSAIAARTGLQPVSAWRVPSGDINRIYPGQIVTYGGTSVSTASSGVGGHVVRSGESLWSIYGSGWQSAAARNGIRSPYVIYPGQYLR